MTLDYISIFLTIAGYIIGLGAVTVIDIHGFFGRKSNYWTEATTRTHKITKPMIWIGTILVILGLTLFYVSNPFPTLSKIMYAIFFILVLNGLFLSFSVSRFLIKREREGRSSEILPRAWQNKITASFIISFIGWWSSLLIFIYQILHLWR